MVEISAFRAQIKLVRFDFRDIEQQVNDLQQMFSTNPG